jgi:hypothetical protein
MLSGKWMNHPDVPGIDVTSPCRSDFRFEEEFLMSAHVEQIGIAGYDDLFGFTRWDAARGIKDGADTVSKVRGVDERSVGIEAGMVMKLAYGADEK